MTRLEISKVPASRHSKVAEKIEDALLSSLAEMNEQSVNSSVVMQVTDENDRLIAGVTGATSYGWFLIKTLWVGEAHRRSGLGTQLMSAAEDEARRLGCHSAWLDTSTSEAREFYLQLGYADFGVLKNGAEKEPANHSRWFMQKSL
ncbi:GNAT family N-acetyltransferase [Shimia sp.]|uniref:GNAT family N-acetyltransferase n=1 Tax=Shimia sp. TaxID=1954381 RepID=UPI003B8D3B8E